MLNWLPLSRVVVAATGCFAVGGLIGCDSQNRFHVAGLDSRWSDEGISGFQAQFWIEAGFTPEQADGWRRLGFTPGEAASWRTVLQPLPAEASTINEEAGKPGNARRWIEAGFRSPQSAGPWIKVVGESGVDLAIEWQKAGFDPASFAAPWAELVGYEHPEYAEPLLRYGIDVSEARSTMTAGMSNFNTDGFKAVHDLVPESGSVQKAFEYWVKGVRRGGVADYERQIEAREREKKANEVRYKKLTASCRSIESETRLPMMSPYAIEGICFMMSPLSVVQWIDRSKVIAISPYVQRILPGPFYVEADSLDTSMVPAALVIGEAPYSYSSTSGAAVTAFRLKVLAWQSDLR